MITQADLQKQAFLIELISALRSSDNWCGETHVQKTAFFVQCLSHKSPVFNFILYKHGPFSFDLSEALSIMGAFKYVEDEVPDPRYGPRLLPNPNGREMLVKQFGILITDFRDEINFASAKLAHYGVAALERLATALFFTKVDRIEDQEARARKIHEVKPHISEVDALKSVKTVDALLSEWEERAKQL